MKFVKHLVKFIICHIDLQYMKRKIPQKSELYLTLPIQQMDLPSMSAYIPDHIS